MLSALVAAVGTAAAACGGGGPAPGSAGGATSSRTPSSAAVSVRSVVAGYPIGLVAVRGRPWVVDAGTGSVGPVGAPATDAARVGTTPLRAAFDGHLIWVTVFGSGRVDAVDPASHRVVRSVAVGGQPEGVVWAFGRIWVVQQKARRLLELTRTGSVEHRISVGREPRLVTANGSALFVSDYKTGRVSRIDPATRTVTTSPHLCAGAQGMVPSGSVLWVTCTPADEVVTVSVRTLRPLGRASVSGEPDAITIHDGQPYVAGTAGPRLVELSSAPRAPAVMSVSVLGHDLPLADTANVDLLMQGSRFWISSPNGGRIVSGLIPS